MIALISTERASHGVTVSDTIRLADYNVLPGVSSDESEGDQWPGLRRRIPEADIMIFGTQIWLGQMSNIAMRIIERMDAFLGETDDQGRMPSFSKIAVAAIVGNEDGAHNVTAELFQALNDEGWTIHASSACYWVDEAMKKIYFQDLSEVPEVVASSAKMLAANAAHLARLLKDQPFPGVNKNKQG